MSTPKFRAAWPALLFVAACGQSPTPAQADSAQTMRVSPRADKQRGPLDTAASLAAIRVAALAGDQQAVQREFREMHGDMMRSMKIPDAGRRIDRESARAVARTVPGVRSIVWIDRDNLLALVDNGDSRNQHTINEICYRLESLGDTLAVVVNLQNATAATGDELEILSRNCQLGPGDRAFMQRNRVVDAIDPRIRDQHEAKQVLMRDAAARKAADDAANEAALLAIPEM